MSNIEEVKIFLESHKNKYCDDCLSDILKIKPRQQINQICNKLKKQGIIQRKLDKCSERVVCKREYKLINSI
ncbi:MAG: hypothetical protein WC268_02525 [Patescibacteria group bacterium]|jgi:hypothetical protein